MTTSFLSNGFRPFFLAAGVYAILPMAAWLFWIGLHAIGGAASYMTISEAPHLWHAHEMIFGFGLAAVTGFLLTAVPNWTASSPLNGLPLLALFCLWLLGRIAMWVNAYIPEALTAAIDVSLVLILFLITFRQLLNNPMPRNIIFSGTLLMLFGGNVLYHLEKTGVAKDTGTIGLNLGLYTIILMIAVIGGRVIPSFTASYIKKQGITSNLPKRLAPIDILSILSIVIYVVLAILDFNDRWLALSALFVVMANIVRFSFWKTGSILGESIVWILHLGYLWLIAGFVLLAIAHSTDFLNIVSARHALATGAAGTMIIAIMTRASLGHTGRQIVTPKPILFSYILITVCALLRTLGPALLHDYYNEIMLLSGALWMIAYMIFVVLFLPIFMKPRADR